ncbi:sensor histidine kinase [Pantanalinema sp. GBBB05]|uniref:sensor histidine kinase n=1 Tax=Pantanalinema sp. GBBB05 TaxID=2604139 RepID=UPI003D815F09
MSESEAFTIEQHLFYQKVQELNASLEQQVQERTAELERSLELAKVLKQVTDEIRSTLNSQTVLQTIVREVRKLLNTDRVVIYRFGPDWIGEVVVEEVLTPWDSILGKTYHDTCFPEEHAQQYLQGRIRAIDHVALSELAPCHKTLLHTMQVQANLVVPIRMHDTLWGLLIAHECRAPRRWQTFETDLLQQLADQAAIAIQQAELYEQSCVAAATAKAHAQQLEQTAQELAQTLQDLQQAQSQLVQTEKMSSLGQLVAGVAHEINNPVNFIYGNLTYAASYAKDLLEVVAAYQAQCPEPNAQTQAILETVDLEFVAADFPKILASMKVGADRIRQIVRSLQSFSRYDQLEKRSIDIHEGIDHTLLILQHRLKEQSDRPAIQVVKDYGDLPAIECYGGQLNQVFMNLISNAIDALEERDSQRTLAEMKLKPSQITIQTHWQPSETDTPYAVIRIEDNGTGMTDEVKTRLFDPFFTTKPVGKGTGLGLSISYQIVVEKHQGRLKCYSQLGYGTVFEIEIPAT